MRSKASLTPDIIALLGPLEKTIVGGILRQDVIGPLAYREIIPLIRLRRSMKRLALSCATIGRMSRVSRKLRCMAFQKRICMQLGN